MNSKKTVTAIFAVLIVMMLAGEVMIYYANPYSYSSDVFEDGDGYGYSVESSGAAEFRIVQTVSGFTPVTEVYIYRDADYGIVNAPSNPEIVDHLAKELAIRGMDSTVIDADGLRQLFLSGDGVGKGVAFLSGALPDTVYTGDPGDPLFSWFDAGGSVYWIGPTIGAYTAHSDGTADRVEGYQSLFFGEGTMSEAGCDVIATEPSGLTEVLCTRNANAQYGVSASVPDSLELGYVTEDGFSSVSLVRMGNGMIGVVGGTFEDICRGDLAQLIASGFTYDSEVVFTSIEEVRGGQAVGRLGFSGKSEVYIFAGGYMTCHGTLHHIM